MGSRKTVMCSITLALGTVATTASAEEITFLVAPRGTPAADKAAALANGKSIIATAKLAPAFDQAAAALQGCATCTITIKLASGPHEPKGGAGGFVFPSVVAPAATVRILGGWDDAFAQRAPLERPSVLVVPRPRSSPMLVFEGAKAALQELVVSGLAIDVAPGNDYDAKTNSLLKGSSSSHAVLQFGLITLERLVVSDNVFVNAANAVTAPTIRAASNSAEVWIVNNIFLNNVHTMTVTSGMGKFLLKRYLIEGNTFALNWPYNPDANTSNPGTLEIGNNYTAALVEIRRNVFVHNAGGAIFPQWDDKRGPKMAIAENLFWDNGQLFGGATPGHGAIVGKFNRGAKHVAYTPGDIQDDFSWATRDNVVLDPKMPFATLKLQAIDQPRPSAQPPAQPSAQQQPQPSAPRSPASPASSVPAADKPKGEAQSAEDFFGIAPKKETPATAPAPAAAAPAAATGDSGSAADFFGIPRDRVELRDDLEVKSFTDGGGNIKNFAPRMPFSPAALPWPKAAEARGYGASPSRVRSR